MEEGDRKKIDKCVDKMVSLIDMESIWPKLFDNQIFRRDDVSVPKWKDGLKVLEVKKDILLKIRTRGPNAFKNLVKCLRETHQDHLINLLENPQTDNSINNNAAAAAVNVLPGANNNVVYDDPEDELTYNPIEAGEVLKIRVKKSKNFIEMPGLELYPMRSNPRGLVLIITLIEYSCPTRKRLSAEHDHNNLIELFTEMGFEVIAKINLTAADIREAVKEFSQNKKLRRVDCCFVIISAHGDRSRAKQNDNQESVIHGVDHTGVVPTPDKEIKCLEIIEYFSAENSPDLAGKPKVFIFQACRGPNKQKAQFFSTSQQATNSGLTDLDIEQLKQDERKFESKVPNFRSQTRSIRNYADILLLQSTLPNHVSFRDTEYGTWLIPILCEVFMKRAHRSHVLKMFQDVDARLEKMRTTELLCQTPTIKIIGFNKKLYINPGYFE